MAPTIFELRHQLVFCFAKNISPAGRKIRLIDVVGERTIVTGTPSQAALSKIYVVVVFYSMFLSFLRSFVKLLRKLVWSRPRMTTISHRKLVLYSRRDILVPELSVVKMNIQTHFLSSHFLN